MVGIAAVGVAVALVGTVVAWQLVGEVDSALDGSLAITEESVATIEDTITLSDQVIGDLSAGLGTLDATLLELQRGIGDAQPVLEDVGRLTTEVPAALEEFQGTLDDVAGAAGEIDAILVQLSQIPFAPEYDPRSSLATQLDALSTDLDPVIETLRGSSGNLAQLTESTGAVRSAIGTLARDVQAIDQRLEASAGLVGRYRQQAGRASDLAAESRADLGDRVATMRILVVLGGVLFAVSQFVPLWVGIELLDSGDVRADRERGA